MVELLAPAGSIESLRVAVNAGADAVYIGGSQFGARAYADNPDEEQLNMGIDYCHLHGKKIYMTVNTLLKEAELERQLYDYLAPYYRNGLDAVIVQDFGVMQMIRHCFPDMEIHASTQMTVTDVCGARLLKELGVTRVVPARELSLAEIRAIIEETGVETETFIHGAMCYSYSGQCLFSSMIGGRSGNRGRCAQPCRLPYAVSQQPESLAGKKGRTQYLLSMKDMCTIDLLPELIGAGIASFKIEGRMKRPEYTAGVVSIYRKYIDCFLEKGAKSYRVDEEDRQILLDLYNRGGFSEGYYHTHNGKEMMALTRPNHLGTEAARIKRTAKGNAEAVALEALHRRDVLELSGGSEFTLSQDVRKGGAFALPCGRVKLQPGDIAYRTKNEFLLESLRAAYLNENNQEKIKGELRIFRGSPAILKVSLGDVEVECAREIAQEAKSAPTTEEAVRRQMNKTGGTMFAFETLELSMDEGLFVPVKLLNELRREGLEALSQAILERTRAGRRIVAPEKVQEKPVDTEGTGVNIDCGAKQSSAECDRLNGCTAQGRGLRLTVSVMTREQLEAVLAFLGRSPRIKTKYVALTETQAEPLLLSGMQTAARASTDIQAEQGQSVEVPIIDTVYIDSLLFGADAKERAAACAWLCTQIDALKSYGYNCFFNSPVVLRTRERKLLEDPGVRSVLAQMDGFLVHTLDGLSYFREYLRRTGQRAQLAADENLYAYNRRALSVLNEQGVGRIAYASELNVRELTALLPKMLSGVDTELTVYGRQALMHSAQCVMKNTKGCTKIPQVLYLRDRKDAWFPVVNRCNICCNTIYNSVPLQLGGCMADIRRLAPSYCRLSFTVEDAAQTKRVLLQYAGLISGEMQEKSETLAGTRGHFRRGVE